MATCNKTFETPKLIMLAAGSGITPMLSLITAIKQSQQLEKTQVQLFILGQTAF